MSKVLKVAWANFRERPVRVALTATATAAAACLVIWIASGYEALLKTFDEYSNLALGRYTLAVAPIAAAKPGAVPPGVAADLRADPAVAAADPMGVERYRVTKILDPAEFARAAAGASSPRGDGPPVSGGPAFHGPDYDVLSTDSPEPPFDMVRGRWLAGAGDDVAVLRADAAKLLDVDVGGEVQVGVGGRKRTLRIVGVVGAPQLTSAGAFGLPVLTPSSGELYVTSRLGERLAGAPPPVRLVGVSLKPDVDVTKFRFGWGPRLSRYSNPVQFQESIDIEEALDQSASAQNVLMQSYAAAGIALLVALLVTFCTLSMGVNERVRQFAVLRAVTFTRAQVRGLIVLEALFLGGLGLVLGLCVGAAILQLVGHLSAKTLYHGIGIGPVGLTLAAVVTVGGSLLACVGPTRRATRVRPIDAMGPQGQPAGAGRVRPLPTLAGLLLIAVNPVVAFAFPPRFESGVYVAMAVGFVSLAVGVLLVAPAVVAVADRAFSPLLGAALRTDARLLRSQITSHLWRSVGAAMSLAVGMGLFVAVQVWGYTMLGAFVPGPWAPDALLVFKPDGLPRDRVAEVAAIPGVDPARCQPVVVEQPRFADDMTGSAERASVTRQDNIVVVGIDPAGAFDDRVGLFQLEWVAGSPAEAVEKMRTGRGCVVPDHFLTETGLTLGDTIELVPPEDPSKTVRYTIVGAVKLPGWHWQTKLTGFRSRTHRAAAMVFAAYDDVAADFGLRAATHVWFNYSGPAADPARIEADARAAYARVTGRPVAGGDAPEGVPSVRVMPVEGIRRFMLNNARRWIWLISLVPLLAMGIAGVGVANVMLASVRARRWEMGVLRAVGFTGGTVARVVLAEGVLIGLVACLLSLVFGVLAGWCGCEFSQYISFFGGLHPPLVVPWGAVGLGLAVTVGVAALAAVVPAILIGRTKPLKLLQEGRGAF
jgi:putative ABC transport system permease protein